MMFLCSNLPGFRIMQNAPQEAFVLAGKAAEIDPNNEYYQLLYASLLQSFDQYDKAAKVYQKVIESNPMNLEYYNKLALAYLYADKIDDAIEVYDDLEAKIGITEEVSLKKQAIYLQERKVDKAIGEVENLIKQFPNETRYYAILAELCLSNGKEDKALEAYQKIIELDPEDPYIHISLADYYRKMGQEEKAFEELKLGFANPKLEIDTKVQILITYYTVTEIYEDLKDQALELSEILIEAHPNNPKSYSIYGDFLYQDKKFEGARDAFRKVISLDSSKYLVWEQLLFSESELNDIDALLDESRMTIELFPEQPLPYLFAGGVLYQKKLWDECIDILNQGVYYVVNNVLMEAQFYAYLGDAYNQVNEDKKSDEAYDKVLRLTPDNDYVLNNYAYYLSLRKENLEKAAEMAKKATELKPNSSSNQDTYGWVLYQMGNYEEARIWIEKAIGNESDPSAVILEHYGDVMWKLGNESEAYDWWLKALDAGKGSEFLEKKVEDRMLYE
ncbi:MAG: tetratricopeptide repeat protein [Bacteroidales bacterium]